MTAADAISIPAEGSEKETPWQAVFGAGVALETQKILNTKGGA